MEEISLREIIETIIDGKRILASFVAVFLLAGAALSFFIIQPQYEAETMLMISPLTNTTKESIDKNSFYELMESLSKYPIMTIETYKEQIKAPVILDYIRSELGLSNQLLSTIADRIKVDAPKDTNLIKISFRALNPETAAMGANLIAKKFTEFVSETNQKQAENSASFIKGQMEKEKENLDLALENLKNFMAQPRGPDELKLELDSKLAQITDFKTQLVQIKLEEETTRASLENARRLLASMPETVVLTKSLLDDEILAGIVKERLGSGTAGIAGIKMSSQEINEAYTDVLKNANSREIRLAELAARKSGIAGEILSRQKEIETLQAELAEKRHKYDLLNFEVELIRQTYDAYQQKYKEAMIKQSVDTGKSSVIVVSHAIPPQSPVSPKKMMNMAISLVLGLMAGIMTVFAIKYWKESDSQNPQSLSGVSAR